jgi:hypothetical protein
MVQAASYPPLQRTQGRGTQSSGTGKVKGETETRATRPDPAGSGWNQYAYATNPNSNVDPSGLQPCSDQASPAICQGGYYGGLSFFLNFTNWDSLEVIQVAPSGGGTYEDGGCANCMTVPAGAVQPGGGQTCYYMLVNPCGGTPTAPKTFTEKLTAGLMNAGTCTKMEVVGGLGVVGGGGLFLFGTAEDLTVVGLPAGLITQTSGAILGTLGGATAALGTIGKDLGVCE